MADAGEAPLVEPRGELPGDRVVAGLPLPRCDFDGEERADAQLPIVLRTFIDRVAPGALAGAPLGAAGAFDEDGVLRAASDLGPAVEHFFRLHEEASVIVPRSSIPAIEKHLQTVRLRASAWSPTLPSYERHRIFGAHSLDELLIWLGAAVERRPATMLFEAIRRGGREVRDWRGATCSAKALIALDLMVSKGAEEEAPGYRVGRRDSINDLVAEIREPEKALRGLVLTGVAGAGKTMVLHRLAAELNDGALRWSGPAVLVNARSLQPGESLLDGLGRRLGHSNAPPVATLLQSRALADNIWLLVDGLDELPLDRRSHVLADVRAWPGPFVLATRRIRETDSLGNVLARAVAPLRPEQQRALLELMSRTDLAALFPGGSGSSFPPSGSAYSSGAREADGLRPTALLLQQLGATPLGLSILAVALRPGEPLPERRAPLLKKGLFYLLERAEHEGLIDERMRRQFERHGISLVGCAAATTLLEGRAIVERADLDRAIDAARIDADMAVELERTGERSGVLQRVGPGEWELPHKSFAEYTAAAWYQQRPERHRELWERAGDPGIDEVIVHLCAISQKPTMLIRRLLGAPSRPLSALALATRICLECDEAALETELLLDLVTRRLRIVSHLPGMKLPGDLGNPGHLWSLVGRFAERLRPLSQAIVVACHQGLRDWLDESYVLRPFEASRYEYSYQSGASWREGDPPESRRHIAERLHALLRFDVPLRVLLRFKHATEILPGERGAWSTRLGPLLSDPEPWIRSAAERAFIEAAPLPALIARWADPVAKKAHHVGMPHSTLVRLAQLEGTALQKRELLLRLGVAEVRYQTAPGDKDSDPSYTSIGTRSHWMRPPGAGVTLSTADWLALWPAAWRVGLLGGWGSSELEPLYSEFLQDEPGEARWRAIVAIGRLREAAASGARSTQDPEHAPPSEREVHRRRAEILQVRTLLSDEFAPARVEAAMLLLREGEPLSAGEWLPLCVSTNSCERRVGLLAAIADGVEPSLEYLVEALSPAPWEVVRVDNEEPRGRNKYFPAVTCAEAALQSHGKEALARLVSYSHDRFHGDTDRARLLDLVDHPRFGAAAEELVGTTRYYLPEWLSAGELLGLLESGRPAQRRWAATTLERTGGEKVRGALVALANDTDEVVARVGREIAKRIEQEAQWRATRAAPSTPRRIAIRETGSLVSGYSAHFAERPSADAPTAEPFDASLLPAFSSFDELWHALADHPVELKSWLTVDYMGRDERADLIGPLAERALDENRQKIRPILDRLNSLFTPDKRKACFDAFDHILLGQWAEWLIAMQPPERDLLGVIGRSERCTERALRIARRTTLESAALDAVIRAAASGQLCLSAPDRAQHAWQRTASTPKWLTLFSEIAGLEGFVRLLEAEPPQAARARVLDEIDLRRAELTKGPALDALPRTAAWARAAAAGEAEEARCVAMRLLALIGDHGDAQRAEEALTRSGERSAPWVPRALELIARHGHAGQAPLLRVLVDEGRDRVRAAAVAALIEHGDDQDTERLFDLLRTYEKSQNEPSFAHDPVNDFPSSSLPELALEGLVRHGDRDAAIRVARCFFTDVDSARRNAEARHLESIERMRAYDERADDESRPPLDLTEYQYRETNGLVPLERVALRIVAEHGRFAEHGLLLLSAILHDPGDHDYCEDMDGYDEVCTEESPIPKEVSAAWRRLKSRLSGEELRRALLRGALWGGPLATVARSELDAFGGPRPIDLNDVLARLAEAPDDEDALNLAERIADSEAGIAQVWMHNGVPWWIPMPAVAEPYAVETSAPSPAGIHIHGSVTNSVIIQGNDNFVRNEDGE